MDGCMKKYDKNIFLVECKLNGKGGRSMLSVFALTSVLTIGPHNVPIFGIGGSTVNSVNCQSDHPQDPVQLHCWGPHLPGRLADGTLDTDNITN